MRLKAVKELEGTQEGKRGLFVGSGPSSLDVSKKTPGWFDSHYDFIIVPNCGFIPLAETAKATLRVHWYAFSVESNIVMAPCYAAVPRSWTIVLNRLNTYWASRHDAPIRTNHHAMQHGYYCGRDWYDPIAKKMHHKQVSAIWSGLKPEIPTWKWNDSAFEPRKYKHGFIMGPPDEIQHSRGTVMLQAMHFAAMLGARSLALSGCELCFVDGVRHYFEDIDAVQPIEPQYETYVELNGEKVRTHKHFANSAAYIDGLYPQFVEAGMAVARHTGQSLLKAIPYEELPP